jgi:hypothetical protein
MKIIIGPLINGLVLGFATGLVGIEITSPVFWFILIGSTFAIAIHGVLSSIDKDKDKDNDE